ncbi:aspartic proteinase precursor [Didymella exigua CBS 183.55]|uniref:Aspartic proteinase n=1 Tax=Didymella exigua CBS 183.55 TaxID=1150837 RepID=A0A6A5RFU7_9PLEO|nr:aspartic proteinase precursor [Didymella exigua CBS 183.55]KAF1924517.1 aspartic proteinase precursor [Didymella exigua CBS 183.55]
MSNLKRVNVKLNPACEKVGVASYTSLLKKYDFAPTTAGPYQKIEQSERTFKNAFRPKSKRETKSVLRKVDESGKPGEVKAEDQQNDALYICPVEIGTPPQLWSTGLDAKTKAARGEHNLFDAKKSTSFKTISGSSWKIRYGDGSTASGIVGTDNVNLGGLCVENQAIELASKLSAHFIKSAGDGLLGLAFGKINTVKPKGVATPVENMITQDDIQEGQELFTCYLGSWRDKDEEDKGESFYTFGYIDREVLDRCGVSEPHWVGIDTTKGFWQFASPSASINGKVIDRGPNTAIADTGSTLALVSDDLCKEIYRAIPDAKFDAKVQGWVFPIGTPVDKLPKVTFAVGDKQFEVQKEDLGFAKVGSGMQYGGIQSRGDSKFDILGDTWLKAVYAIFDQGKKRFGCVQRIERYQNIAAAPTSGKK